MKSKYMIKLNCFLTKDKLFYFSVLMPLIMLLGVGLVFFPFGFHQLGLIEEWGELAMFTEHGPLYFVTKYTTIAATRMRPLNMLPPSLGYVLDPDSFFYWHMLQFLFVWLKGIGMGFILLWLYPQRWVAIIGGLLMMFYPADTMQLSLRSLHINEAAGFTLCAVALILWATQAKGFWERAVLACSGGILFVCASFTYEAAFFLAPMPLILWWIKYGFREGWSRLKSQRFVLFIWILAIMIELSYLLWVGMDPDLYQSGYSNSPLKTLGILFKNAHLLLKVGLYRTFLHSWLDSVYMLLAGGEWIFYLPIAIVAILLLVLGFSANNHFDRKTVQISPGLFTRWLVGSILIAALGYSPYLVALSHIYITQRTYFFAGMGGALLFSGLIAILQERVRWVGAGMAGCLLLLGIAAQWTQFEHYKAISDKQKTILSGILESAPRLNSKQNLLIIDHTGSLGNTWMLRGEVLASALSYLYGKNTDVYTCMEPGLVRSSFIADPAGRAGRCEEQKDAWLLSKGSPTSFSLPKENLVTLIIEQDGRIHPNTADTPRSPATPNEQARWTKIFGCWPANACLAKLQGPPFSDRFSFHFGKWWSMEEPIPGVGWQDSQWMVPARRPRSVAWMNQPKSTLLFNLTPRAVPYFLDLSLALYISEPAKESLKVLVNGHPVQHYWRDMMHVRAEIDPVWLKDGVNELLFLTELHPTLGISLGIKSVKIEPQKKK